MVIARLMSNLTLSFPPFNSYVNSMRSRIYWLYVGQATCLRREKFNFREKTKDFALDTKDFDLDNKGFDLDTKDFDLNRADFCVW